MKYKLLFLNILIIFVLCGCVTLTEKTGRLLDGTVCKEKKKSRYKTEKGAAFDLQLFFMENKLKEKSIMITAKKYPFIKLRAAEPDDEGVFHFTSLDFLSGSPHGWIEFSLQLFGTGRLLLTDTASLEITQIEPVIITSGKIHRYDTRLTGDNALSALRNRRERITALTDWMNSLNDAEFQSADSFSEYWKPLLLPETVKKKKRPENWSLADDQFKTAEDVKWNTGYTERVFPEELWQVRNTGTLLRDWEEALYWIYLEHQWDFIINSINSGIVLKKIK